MAISDTISSIEDNIRADYEGLENIGADLTGINKNILNIRTILDTIYNDMPKVTGEGIEVILTPTRKGRLALIPKGNSIQEGEPTPTSPIPIKSVTGDNNVVVNNINLLDITDIRNDIINNNGTTRKGYAVKAPFTATYYVTFKEVTRTYYYGKSTDLTQSSSNLGYASTSNTPKTATISLAKDEYFVIWCDNNVTPNISDKIMLSWIDTEYVPYQNQTKPLNLGSMELNGINTYKNLIFKAENGDTYYDSLTSEQKALLTYGARYYHEEIGSITLNGTENWTINRTGTANWYYNLSRTTDIINETPAEVTMCDHYSIVSISTTNTNQGLILTSSFIRVRYGTEDTIPNWKTWLSTHNVKIKYVKSTPTDIQITDTTLISQLEDIDKMKSYEGTTIITSTYQEGNSQMILSASSLKGE